MTKDKTLEELFLAQKPHFDDNEAFMESLTKRLDAVEFLKQHQEATIHRYKMAMVVAFIVGIISGGISIVYIMSMPTDVPLFTFQVQNGFLLWLSQNTRMIVSAVLALLMTVGVISIINNVQEIMRMRVRMTSYKVSPKQSEWWPTW
ncbi:MAG: hypothetical protein J6Y04_03025 [Bacteroidaceae bacterium]|nr:hypothetical protein [Bacteroidaceae bacterium]